jgi:SAM-dependent methyltransferase
VGHLHPGKLKRIARTTRDLALKSLSAVERVIGRDPLLPPAHLRVYYYRSLTRARFLRACQEARTELVSRGLQPTHRVLDVGCGVGNLAVGLMDYTTAGYVGIDVHAEAIDWCRGHITTVRPDFEFHRADVFNQAYNPTGDTEAEDYRWPLDDDSCDFVHLGSVFTHMLPEGVKRYVQEISRVLAPGGSCTASYFLLNDETRRCVDQGSSFLSFGIEHASGHCRMHRASVPEAAVAFEESYIRAIYEQAGLAVREVHRGGWAAGRAHEQDVLVSTPMGDGAGRSGIRTPMSK